MIERLLIGRDITKFKSLKYSDKIKYINEIKNLSSNTATGLIRIGLVDCDTRVKLDKLLIDIVFSTRDIVDEKGDTNDFKKFEDIWFNFKND